MSPRENHARSAASHCSIFFQDRISTRQEVRRRIFLADTAAQCETSRPVTCEQEDHSPVQRQSDANTATTAYVEDSQTPTKISSHRYSEIIQIPHQRKRLLQERLRWAKRSNTTQLPQHQPNHKERAGGGSLRTGGDLTDKTNDWVQTLLRPPPPGG